MLEILVLLNDERFLQKGCQFNFPSRSHLKSFNPVAFPHTVMKFSEFGRLGRGFLG